MPGLRSIAFVDPFGWAYDPETPLKAPLGGTQSGACYLSAQLAARGYRVALFNGIDAPSVVRGVRCIPAKMLTAESLGSYDIVVTIGHAHLERVLALRTLANKGARLFLWTGHAPDQAIMTGLSEERVLTAIDGLIMVSEWQATAYYDAFGIERERMIVLGNGISPAFANLFLDGRILESKSWPPVLAYTSAPNRGLERLLPAFERIRQKIPGARLRVFSSFAVYKVPLAEDPCRDLYKKCRRVPGVEYVGSVPQQALANALKRVTALAYPNTFYETSCICVMEAMAAGCEIITSEFGALPETCNGFAHLMTPDRNAAKHIERYAELAIKVLQESHAAPDQSEQRLQRQVAFATTSLSWETRAQEWDRWLSTLSPRAA